MDNKIIKAPESGLATVDLWQPLLALIKQTTKANTWRVYGSIYRQWVAWCDEQGLQYTDITPDSIRNFLLSRKVSYDRRKTMLVALRRVAEYLAPFHINDPMWQVQYAALLNMTAPDVDTIESERNLDALSPSEVDIILSIWQGSSPLHIRNRAIVSTLFATWMRRFELAKLRWRDVNLDRGIIKVVRGKRDKDRDVSILGEYAIPDLLAWQKLQPSGYEYVFTPISGRKVGKDKPISPDTVHNVVLKTVAQSGIDFRSHTARRTGITEWLQTGGTVVEAKEQAGHESEHMVLKYARAVNAEERRKRWHGRYGNRD